MRRQDLVITIAIAAATLCGLLITVPVWAAGGAEAGGAEGKVNLFAGDFGNALWTLVIFVILLWVLGKFAWGPVLSALQKREAFIRDSLEQARRDREEAEARLKEYNQQLTEARGRADALMQEAQRHAAEVKQRIEADARTEAEAILARARQEIELATDAAVQQIYAQGARLATEAASRIIAKELKPADHERLVAESIASIERLELN